MIIKSLILDRNAAAILPELKKRSEGNCAVIVTPGEEARNIFSAMIDKQLVKKQDATAEMNEAIAWFNSLGAGENAEINEGIDRLRHYLVESMPFRFSGNSLQDYIFAELSVLCAKFVAAVMGADSCQDGRNLMICDDSASVVDAKAAAAAIQASRFEGLTVLSGGYGRTLSGYSVSLGRGGAELTATTLASVLHPECIEFLTEQNGIQGIPELEYNEAATLLSGEDSPIFPLALLPATREDIPIRVCNINDLDAPGTMVTRKGGDGAPGITGLTSDTKLELITVYGAGLLGSVGLSSTLFNALANAGVNVRFISQATAEFSISFAVNSSDSAKAIEAIAGMVKGKTDADVLYASKAVAAVSVCGNRMRSVPGISGKVFTALGNAGVSIVAASQGGEELTISVIVDAKDAEAAVAAIRPLVG